MPLHRSLAGGDLHGIIAFVFPTPTSQAAAAVTSADIGKVALRQSDATVWLLAAVSPVLWIPLSGGGGGGVVSPTASTSLIGVTYFNCPSSIQVGDFVYLESADTIGLASADSIDTMPCIGAVFTKPTDTTATVQYVGDVENLTGLVPDTTYYISPVPGETITNVLPEAPAGGTVVLQRVGSARNETTLILSLDATDFVVLQG